MHFELNLIDLGDAVLETRQHAPMPLAVDNIYAFGYPY
jgi:hypothetical protein